VAPADPARVPERLVFLGTPEASVPPLRALVSAGFDVALVVTRPDKRRGRRGDLSPSPVKAAAVELGLPVSHDVDDVLGTGADLGVVVAFGRIIKPHVLAALPMVNLHFSLLPRWRGAAPVERAVLAGDERTGVCVMEVVDELDAGGVYRRAEVPVGDRTADELRAELVAVGTDLLVDTLRGGLGVAEPQTGEVTYAEKITSDDLHLDLSAAADRVAAVVRVGGAWTTFRGHRLKVWSVAAPKTAGTGTEAPAPTSVGELRGPAAGCGPAVGTGSGWLELVEVQPEGKARTDARSWWNGARPAADERLGA
jgi:methionyl-tRNA formyltransferase